MAGKPYRIMLLLAAAVAAGSGCGTTKSRIATEQLLMSDAVDDAIGVIDFRPLAGEKVFFDTRYLVNVKGVGFVNSEYVISSFRQQMIAADVRLQDKADDADYIVEGRVGTLGTDGNEIVYGIPANRGLSEAASVIPNAPALPAIPELSLARKESQQGAVKVAAFAYGRKTGEPIWQSGMSRARTSSQDVWVFGAGPFQNGSIHGRTRFAGNEIHLPGRSRAEKTKESPSIALEEEVIFKRLHEEDEHPVTMAQHSEPESSKRASGSDSTLSPAPPGSDPKNPPQATPVAPSTATPAAANTLPSPPVPSNR